MQTTGSRWASDAYSCTRLLWAPLSGTTQPGTGQARPRRPAPPLLLVPDRQGVRRAARRRARHVRGGGHRSRRAIPEVLGPQALAPGTALRPALRRTYRTLPTGRRAVEQRSPVRPADPRGADTPHGCAVRVLAAGRLLDRDAEHRPPQAAGGGWVARARIRPHGAHDAGEERLGHPDQRGLRARAASLGHRRPLDRGRRELGAPRRAGGHGCDRLGRRTRPDRAHGPAVLGHPRAQAQPARAVGTGSPVGRS